MTRFRLESGQARGVPLPTGDFGESTEARPSQPPPITEDGGSTRYDALGLFGLDRRRYRRIAFDELATLVHEGRHQGPGDVSRGGASVVAPVAPAQGALVEVLLPADDGEADGLTLEGKVARTQLLAEPVERGGQKLPTFHCFTCGWTGFWDPVTRELATTVRRNPESTLGGSSRMRVTDGGAPGQPDLCPICAAIEPSFVPQAIYRVGVNLGELGPRDAERLAQYVSRLVMRKEGLGRRKHDRTLAEYVPMRVDCSFSTPAELANAYLRDISQGGIGFTSSEELKLGTEVRVAIRASEAKEGFVLAAQIVSRQAAGTACRYGARFLRFGPEAQTELRTFIEAITENAVARTERAQTRAVAVKRVWRELWLGIAVGIVLAVVAAVLLSVRR